MKIPIVNENDEVIEYKERDDVVDGDIVRITAIWITDQDGNILLAQRALTKKYSPGLWGPAVAGTVEEGETYEENAYKELEEEIGVKGFKLESTKKVLYTSRTGSKFCHFFKLSIPKDTELKLQQKEVEQVKWFSKEEFMKLLEDKPGQFVHQFTLLKDLISSI